MPISNKRDELHGAYTYLVEKLDSGGYRVIDREGSVVYTENDSNHAENAIQYAIDNLPDGGKIVLSEGDYYCSSAPTYRDNIIIEGQGPGTVIKLQSDITPFSLHNLYRTHVRNLDVEVSEGHTEAILELFADGTGAVGYCSFENINIRNPYATHDFTGIRLKMDNDRYILENQFKQIYIGECNKGIHIKGLSDNVWANGNYFEKIFAEGFVTFIDFDGTTTKTNLANRNTFVDCKAQTKSYSVDGIKNIYRWGNVFLDCLIWDWYIASSPNYKWSIDADARETIIIGTDVDASSSSVQDNAPDTKWFAKGNHYLSYAHIRTVASAGANYSKLSNALADITDASSTNRYCIVVFGKVTDDAQIVAKSHVDVLGFNAEIESTYAGDFSLSVKNITDATFRDITIRSKNSGYTINIGYVGSDIKFYNCNFFNEKSDGTYLAAVNLANGAQSEFYNCIAKGSDNGNIGSAGWRMGGFNATPLIKSCIGYGNANGASAFDIRQGSSPRLVNCLAIPGKSNNSYGYWIQHTSAPKLTGCKATPEKQACEWAYTSANNGRFRPFAGHPYQIIGLMVWVNTAHAGVTLDIGTTVGGSEIASGIDISTTGSKFPNFSREEVAADGYMYATPSSAISDGDLTIYYVVVYNYSNNRALYLDTKGYAIISNCTFLSNGASDAVYIAETTTKNWRMANCHIETYDPANQYGINAAAQMSGMGEKIQNCTIIGGVNNIEGVRVGPSKGFKATSQSVSVGVSDAYGDATTVTSPSGVISSLRVCKIVIGGSFAAGENVTVKVETNWDSGNTAYVEKTYTATGTQYLDLDGQDGLDLWRDSDTCISIKIYAKSDQASTSVTVTCDLAGAG